MDAQETLDQAIQNLVTEKTLSAEALEALKNIVDENKRLKSSQQLSEETIARLNQMVRDLAAQVSELTTQEGAVKAREVAVTEREKEIQKLEFTAQYAELRRNDVIDMFRTVFRNPIVRTTVQKTHISAPNKDQYGNIIYPTHTTVNDSEIVEQE